MAAIVGLGVTEMGKIYGRTPADFAGEAIALALEDAGLRRADVDGLLVNWNAAPGMDHRLAAVLGFRDLALVAAVGAAGSTAGAMLQWASLAVDAGIANAVMLVYADAPLRPNIPASDSYRATRAQARIGMEGVRVAYGEAGATPGYALATRRHMHRFGTTSEQLGAIAVSTRAWAAINPAAQMRTPITIADHQASRMVAEPLHLFDCCLVSNGGVAVIVTGNDRARHLRRRPVYVWSAVQAVTGEVEGPHEPGIDTGARLAGPRALAAAGVRLEEIDVLELYDCYTYTVLVTLEDYGFCSKGDGGAFVEDGKLGPGGSLPTNTGGGQLSGWYMWGFSPLAEGIVQARGDAGERQVPEHDLVLVSGNGGVLDLHSTAILGAHPPV